MQIPQATRKRIIQRFCQKNSIKRIAHDYPYSISEIENILSDAGLFFNGMRNDATNGEPVWFVSLAPNVQALIRECCRERFEDLFTFHSVNGKARWDFAWFQYWHWGVDVDDIIAVIKRAKIVETLNKHCPSFESKIPVPLPNVSVPVMKVLKNVAREHQLTPAFILSKSKWPSRYPARADLILVLRDLLGFSNQCIVAVLGVNISTVQHVFARRAKAEALLEAEAA